MKRMWMLVLVSCAALRAEADALFGTERMVRPSRNYDVVHYTLELRFDQQAKKVFGKATIRFTPLKSSLDSIDLHAMALDVQSVSLANKEVLRFANRESLLTVYFHKSFSLDDTIALVVEYTASPRAGLYFMQPDSTNPRRRAQIWTQGEDINNRHWFPCWDFPNDKATSEVIATVKDSWTLLSNGKLVGVRHDKHRGTKTFHWYQSKPHASYLIMLAAGEYTVVRERYRTKPLEYYLYSDRIEDGKRSLSATPAAMKFFEEVTGFPYPWEKFAQIFITDFMWGGMENTSAVTLNESYLIDHRGLIDFTADDVVAHELAHQWFGDVVTCRDWTELWLNEGFANYFEALFKRHAKGKDEYQLDLMQQASAVLRAEQSQGRKPIVTDHSLTTNLYSKGAWVLYMLHTLLGEREFQRAITHYLQRNAFTSVSTYDFRKAVEEATGQNLDWFFEQWLYKAGYPDLHVTRRWDDSAKTLILTFRQMQKLDSLTGIFVAPIDVECTTAQGRTLTRVLLKEQELEVRIALAEAPAMVIVDKGMKLLKSLTFEKSKDEWVYQLLHAEDIVDRMTAAKALRAFPEDTVVYEALKRAAMDDGFWAVRREATIYLGTMKHDGVKDAMLRIARDAKSSVRTAAVVALERFPSPEVGTFLQSILTTDSSYLVRASCLEALKKVDSVAAVRLALQYADSASHRDVLQRAALQVLRHVKRPEALPIALRYVQPGVPTDIRALALGILSEVGESDSLSRSMILKLTGDFSPSIRKSAVRALAVMGGEDAHTVLLQRKEAESDPDVKEEIESALRDFGE
ncbi:MAG: hypothetical protein C4326_00070 [Ignavibacteria bacterium]